MAKTSKAPATEGSKAITDYFSRKPTTRSNRNKSTGASDKTKQNVESMSLLSHSQQTLAPERRTRMRSRTPEISTRELSQPPSPAKPSGKRKSKFSVETMLDTSNAVLVVTRSGSVPPASAIPPTPLSPTNKSGSVAKNDSRKKIRFSSPSLSEVPGSVSGEEEISCAPRVPYDVEASRQAVAEWREQTSSPLSEPPESMDMDVDEAPMPNSPTNDSAMIPERTTPSPYQRLTPPTSVHQPVNAPSSADVTARTKQLIADIKAKAMAQVKANPTEAAKSLEFREDLSDSDSDDDLQPLEAEVKGKAKTVGEAARPPPGASTRYNTRSADAQASSSKANRVSPIALQSERRKSANKKDNPFLALLKEKRDEERSGRSTMDYIKAAEIALAKDRMLLEMDDEDGDDGLSGPSEYQQANSGKEADEIKVDLDDRDRERLFGDQGAQIKGILDDDRENREADERLQSRVGVPFWKRNAGNDDAVTSAKPALDFGNYANQPILSMLHKAFELADEKRSIAILNLGLLNTLNYENHAGVVDYLSYLALTPKCEQLGSAAFKALINIWTVSSTGRTPGISLQSILNAVSGLGATAEYLNLLPAENPNLDDERRNTLVFRMIKMIESSARRRLLNPTEVPGIVPVLLAISLDPSTSVSLQDEITLGLDAIFQSIADPNVVADIEPSICTEVLAYISNLDTVNISHVVTLLAGGTGRGTRIARWVARSVLLDRTEVAEGEYCHTPAVDDLSAILVQGKPTSCQAFQVNKDTDYVEMGYFVQILAVALTDISDYLPREIAAIAELKAGQCSQKSPSKEKPETPFQYLENCMTFLHRKITDHGTDIERSRTKAALHHLTMRLHYQLKAGTRSNKSNNIDHYFSRGNVGPRA